jgi:hypothetical protein
MNNLSDWVQGFHPETIAATFFSGGGYKPPRSVQNPLTIKQDDLDRHLP